MDSCPKTAKEDYEYKRSCWMLFGMCLLIFLPITCMDDKSQGPLIVEVILVERSDLACESDSDPEDALIVCEYRVTRIVSGLCRQKLIRIAHRADGKLISPSAGMRKVVGPLTLLQGENRQNRFIVDTITKDEQVPLYIEVSAKTL